MRKTIINALAALATARHMFNRMNSAEPKEALAARDEVNPPEQRQTPQPTPSARQLRRKEAIAKRRLQRRQKRRQLSRAKKMLIGLITSFALVVGVIASLAGLDSYYASRINVSPVYSLDPADPFSTRFLVSNDGSLPIYDVKNWCYVNDVSNDVGARIGPVNAYDAATDASEMGPTVKNTVRCRVPVAFTSPASRGDITIFVSYKPKFYPWRREKIVRLIGERGSDGVFHWSEQPLPQSNK